MRIREDVYRLCGCGSVRKYQFCCLDLHREHPIASTRTGAIGAGPNGAPLVLLDLAKGLGPSSISARDKESLIARIARRISVPDVVRTLSGTLSPESSSALRDVAGSGGRMAYEEFTRRHGSDDKDSDLWSRFPPASTLGRLKSIALLAEGTIGARELVVIPAEVRGAL